MKSYAVYSIVPCLALTFLGLFRPFKSEIKNTDHFIVGSGVLTERPIIGIVLRADKFRLYGDDFADATYIRNLHMAGARVVPIRNKRDRPYYEKIFKSVNGVFLPGGSGSFMSSPYKDTARIMFNMAIEANDRGDYFPIWGTCFGFEIMVKLISDEFSFEITDTKNMSMPVNFYPGYKEGRLFQHLPTPLLKYSSEENFSHHNHRWSPLLQDFKNDIALTEFYRVLSTNTHGDYEIVSTLEAYNYPFYGVIWHPERNVHAWNPNMNIDYRYNSLQISRYLVDFFVGEARKNSHQFESNEEAALAFIENGKRIYQPSPSIGERYYFNHTDDSEY